MDWWVLVWVGGGEVDGVGRGWGRMWLCVSCEVSG